MRSRQPTASAGNSDLPARELVPPKPCQLPLVVHPPHSTIYSTELSRVQDDRHRYALVRCRISAPDGALSGPCLSGAPGGRLRCAQPWRARLTSCSPASAVSQFRRRREATPRLSESRSASVEPVLSSSTRSSSATPTGRSVRPSLSFLSSSPTEGRPYRVLPIGQSTSTPPRRRRRSTSFRRRSRRRRRSASSRPLSGGNTALARR